MARLDDVMHKMSRSNRHRTRFSSFTRTNINTDQNTSNSALTLDDRAATRLACSVSFPACSMSTARIVVTIIWHPSRECGICLVHEEFVIVNFRAVVVKFEFHAPFAGCIG